MLIYLSNAESYLNLIWPLALCRIETMLWTFPNMNTGLFASISGPPSGMDAYCHRIVSFYFSGGLCAWHDTLAKQNNSWFSFLS